MEGPLTAHAPHGTGSSAPARRAPRGRFSTVFRDDASTPTATPPAIDDGHVVLTYRELAAGRDAGRRAACRRRAPPATGSASGSPPAPPSCTSRSWASCAAGAAYVPVDADDPDERARAGVRRGRRGGRPRGPAARRTGAAAPRGPDAGRGARPPTTTPGSSSPPARPAPQGRGGVTTARAAAFVDAEARLFLQDAPLGPRDRVLAGLSVAFDASCEEMWLAWRHGACLVPAPRALVRSGMDLGPWLVGQRITVVSTVPTLAALWPAEALARSGC